MIELITFFAGWLIGASVREKRIKAAAEKLAVNFVMKERLKYDNVVLRGIWEGQREYLKIMIRTAESGVSIEDMKMMFEMQMDYVEQELAVEQTKEILL